MNLNQQDIRGWTALHYAAHGGHLSTVRRLVELGANPLVRDVQGRTAYDVATDPEIRTFLLLTVNISIVPRPPNTRNRRAPRNRSNNLGATKKRKNRS